MRWTLELVVYDIGTAPTLACLCFNLSTCSPCPHTQITNRMVDGARGVLNALLADVYVFTDAVSGAARWVDVY